MIPFRFPTVPKKQTKSDTITLSYTIDNPNIKVVYAFTKEKGRITLWEGAEYDAIGQWKDSDVQAKLQDILKNG